MQDIAEVGLLADAGETSDILSGGIYGKCPHPRGHFSWAFNQMLHLKRRLSVLCDVGFTDVGSNQGLRRSSDDRHASRRGGK